MLDSLIDAAGSLLREVPFLSEYGIVGGFRAVLSVAALRDPASLLRRGCTGDVDRDRASRCCNVSFVSGNSTSRG